MPNLENDFSAVVEEAVHDVDGAFVRHHADEECQEPRKRYHLHYSQLVQLRMQFRQVGLGEVIKDALVHLEKDIFLG